jgi:hypoxanthine phosphoribosyltransferase
MMDRGECYAVEENIREILLDEAEIARRVKELAAQISEDYQGKDLVLVCILKGAVIFTADLARHITVPVTIDFMATSSYGEGTQSTGVVRFLKDLDEPIEGRHVLIVEDIVDTGLTLKYLHDNLISRHPASLKICTLLDKPDRRVADIKTDYNGFIIPDEFVVGYGLDYAEGYRHLPYIGILKPEVYS